MTIATHVAHMKQEVKRSQPNTDAIIDKLKRTCAYRRKYCQENTTADVLLEFPALRLKKMVRQKWEVGGGRERRHEDLGGGKRLLG